MRWNLGRPPTSIPFTRLMLPLFARRVTEGVYGQHRNDERR
jgi:hypothetical protein